jgi:uncharacterized membrane protein YfcA
MTRWLVGASYTAAFVLGAGVDILRHALERVIPAFREGRVDDAIVQRALLAAALVVVVSAGVWLGARWSGRRLGPSHRSGFLALFLLTPAVVYVLEH